MPPSCPQRPFEFDSLGLFSTAVPYLRLHLQVDKPTTANRECDVVEAWKTPLCQPLSLSRHHRCSGRII